MMRAPGQMDLLRFSTAGSVDDGKCTLIGRLLYDSKTLFEDQLEALERRRHHRRRQAVNLALLTDGLRAEREQGITIDVAYRYFATPRRKFIIADTPGHVQYTRNMVTGASTANLAIVLVDARQGVARADAPAHLHRLAAGHPAPRRRGQQDGPRRLERGASSSRSASEFAAWSAKLDVHDVTFIPISALNGDNVVDALGEHALVRRPDAALPPRDVHIALGPEPDRRPLPGAVGDPAADRRAPRLSRLRRARSPAASSARATRSIVLPSGTQTRITRIEHVRRRAREAFPPMSVSIELEDDIDISRGDMICRPQQPADGHAGASTRWCAGWPTRPLEPGGRYVHQAHDAHGQRDRRRPALPDRRQHAAPRRVGRDARRSTRSAACTCARARRCWSTSTASTAPTGSFILIDETTNDTVGAGMIVDPGTGRRRLPSTRVADDLSRDLRSRVNFRSRWRRPETPSNAPARLSVRRARA